MAKRLSGVALKKAILRSKFLPDHPEPFRKQMVVNALAQENIEYGESTLDMVMMGLLTNGYLIRTADPVKSNTFQPFCLWMFARTDRASTRPGWRTGEQYDLWGTAPKKEPR